jgi:hypothetical protein
MFLLPPRYRLKILPNARSRMLVHGGHQVREVKFKGFQGIFLVFSRASQQIQGIFKGFSRDIFHSDEE